MDAMNYHDIEILYEDNHLLVVNKPINMLTQGDITGDVNLLDLMKEYIRVEYNKPGEAFLALVHRLDRPTGGVIVFAKTSKCASRLSDQIRRRVWKKGYLVITDGIVYPQQDKLIDYLYKNEKTNTSYVVDNNHPQAKKAILNYKTRANQDNYSLVDVDLITGRSHQIRVQFQNIGTPLWGDSRYNQKAKPNQKMALFAHKLTIEHPTLKHEMTFELDPPQDYPWNLFV